MWRTTLFNVITGTFNERAVCTCIIFVMHETTFFPALILLGQKTCTQASASCLPKAAEPFCVLAMTFKTHTHTHIHTIPILCRAQISKRIGLHGVSKRPVKGAQATGDMRRHCDWKPTNGYRWVPLYPNPNLCFEKKKKITHELVSYLHNANLPT